MGKMKRDAAIAMFGSSYEVDYGASLPHFSYSDFTRATILDDIADRWMERASDTKIVKVYECLGRRRSSASEGWNKFFAERFAESPYVSANELTAAVIAHAAGEYERARKALTGSRYRSRSVFNRVFGSAHETAFSVDNRIFSDLRVVIVPLPEELDLLTDDFLAPGDKIFHLISSNILEGTRIIEYTVRDRQLAQEGRTRYKVKYTAVTDSSTMPLHFELREREIWMASYGDCTSPYSSGPLFLTLDQAKRAEALIWEKASVRLAEFNRTVELQ
jgi:hypothetical protein